MKSRHNGGLLVFCTALCLLLPSLAGAGFYIAGQVGATFPHDFSVDEASGLPTGEMELPRFGGQVSTCVLRLLLSGSLSLST